METKLNFKSQICTTREQSERLLALGLKKETADMTHHYLNSIDSYELKGIEFSRIIHLQELTNKRPIMGRTGDDLYAKDIPAWSLDRLRELIPENIFTQIGHRWQRVMYNVMLCYQNEAGETLVSFHGTEDYYERCVVCLEWLIKEGYYFNTEYLCEK